MAGTKRRRRRITCVQDVIELEGCTSYDVRNKSGAVLWRQSNPLIQKYDRDVHTALTQRWINDETCRPLNTKNVKLRDNVAVLPEARPQDSNDFVKLFYDYIVEVHGRDGSFHARDHLLLELRKPHLDLFAFSNLYYHPFLQGVGDLSDFPARIIENIKFRKIWYDDTSTRWDFAYSGWEGKRYKRDIDLMGTCMVDILVLRVYIGGRYTDDPANEARLVRNIIIHLDEQKFKEDGVKCTKQEIAETIYELFPNIAFKLFEFCQFHHINLDFNKQRQFLVLSNSEFAV